MGSFHSAATTFMSPVASGPASSREWNRKSSSFASTRGTVPALHGHFHCCVVSGGRAGVVRGPTPRLRQGDDTDDHRDRLSKKDSDESPADLSDEAISRADLA